VPLSTPSSDFFSNLRMSFFSLHQGCQIILDTMYQNEENCTKYPLNYQMAIKYILNGRCRMQTAIKYTNIFHFKTL
jgi:hypothetical protein